MLLLAKSETPLSEFKKYEPVEAVCLFVLIDHIREEAYDTIKWFNDNDVDIKIISGDNPLTVSQIAKKVGVKNADNYISLDDLSDEEVQKICTEYTIFGRVSPEQKAILIKSLKQSGKTVAMTGDGVNDILAMKQANCSIAIASGSEAARNSAHLVLMDSNFASMPKVVEEGRRVINNIQQSATLFLMKTIYAIVMALVCLITWRPDPFAPSSFYVLEFAVIGIPSFALALQPNKNLVKAKRNVMFVFALYRPLISFLYFSAIALVFLIGFPMVKEGKEIFGTIFNFGLLISFYNYTDNFFGPIQNISEQFDKLQAGIVASGRIFNILDMESTIVNDKEPLIIDKFKGKIEFKHVYFA